MFHPASEGLQELVSLGGDMDLIPPGEQGHRPRAAGVGPHFFGVRAMHDIQRPEPPRQAVHQPVSGVVMNVQEALRSRHPGLRPCARCRQLHVRRAAGYWTRDSIRGPVAGKRHVRWR
ncbi:hypothetical protein EASAB2608_07358 [Streptomyces sp. EAS-AB2608]|nr:hypothetical protein EASAB2608_07358 [Streptomyces sp. EAS-AB2608]